MISITVNQIDGSKRTVTTTKESLDRKVRRLFMFTLEDIEGMSENQVNEAITQVQKKIEHNERCQDNYAVLNGGEYSAKIWKEHDRLCDTMERLCNRRRAISAI